MLYFSEKSVWSFFRRGSLSVGLGLRGPDNHIISCHSKTLMVQPSNLVTSIGHILDEFQQNRSTTGVATADFLMSGPTDWWINFCFVLLETN